MKTCYTRTIVYWRNSNIEVFVRYLVQMFGTPLVFESKV